MELNKSNLIILFLIISVGLIFFTSIINQTAITTNVFTQVNESLDITPAKYVISGVIAGYPSCDPESEVCTTNCTKVFNPGMVVDSWSFTEDELFGTKDCQEGKVYPSYVHNNISCQAYFGLSDYLGDCAVYTNIAGGNITTYSCPGYVNLSRQVVVSDCKCTNVSGNCGISFTDIFNFSNAFFAGNPYSIDQINSSIGLAVSRLANNNSPSECLPGENDFSLLNQTNSTQIKNKDYNMSSIGYVYLNNSLSLNSTDKSYITYEFCSDSYVKEGGTRAIISLIGLLFIIGLIVIFVSYSKRD